MSVREAARAVISYVNRYSADFDSDFIKLVDGITIALAAEPSWIPVAERLPEPNTTILVYKTNGKVAIWTIFANEGVGGFTHWQPLPEPPEPPAYMRAMGVLDLGDEKPEDIIRRMRG